MPTEAITMGVATILAARSVVLMAWGERKAPTVAAALEGPRTAEVPASFLQGHADVRVVLDRGAASVLQVKATGKTVARCGVAVGGSRRGKRGVVCVLGRGVGVGKHSMLRAM